MNLEIGDKVVYIPKQEPGVIKSFNQDKTIAFVWYHSGCTASGTKVTDLEKKEMKGHELVHTGCIQCLGGIE